MGKNQYIVRTDNLDFIGNQQGIMTEKSISPKISIIIPNLHSPIIDRTIRSILDQEIDHSYEIIVIGMDQFNLIDQTHDQVHFIETEHPTPPAIARNMGVAASSGEYVFFIDADCIAMPHWLEKHMQVHQRSQKPVVVGGGVEFPRDHYLTLSDNVSTFHEFMTHNPPGEKDFLPSLNLSIPRNVWDHMGGFNPDFPYPSGEDTDLTLRIKQNQISVLFCPEAKIKHLPSRHKIGELFRHAFRFGKYSVKSNPAFWKILFVPFPLRHWLLTIFFSPILSLYVVLKMVFHERLPFVYWHTLPIVFLLKLAWCFGYAQQLRIQKGSVCE